MQLGLLDDHKEDGGVILVRVDKLDRKGTKEFVRMCSLLDESTNKRLAILGVARSEPWSSGDFNGLEDNDRLIFAIIDDKYVGYTLTHLGDEDAWISNVFVDSKYRGNGIGTKLMDETRAMCLDEDMATVGLNVISNNVEAIKLYKKFGLIEFSLSMRCKL